MQFTDKKDAKSSFLQKWHPCFVENRDAKSLDSSQHFQYPTFGLSVPALCGARKLPGALSRTLPPPIRCRFSCLASCTGLDIGVKQFDKLKFIGHALKINNSSYRQQTDCRIGRVLPKHGLFLARSYTNYLLLY